MKNVKLLRPWTWTATLQTHSMLLNKYEAKGYAQKETDDKKPKTPGDDDSEKKRDENKKHSGEKRARHGLVVCKESDTVSFCIKEPNALCTTENLPSKTEDNEKLAIIIGAGISGLFAAVRLLSCNITDFIILEAKNRPGGRVKTVKLNETVIDLGADSIRGATLVSPIYQFASLDNLISEESSRANTNRGIFLTSDARSIEGDERVFREFQAVLDNITVEPNKEYAGCKMFDYIEEKMKEKIDKFPEWQRYNAMIMVYSLINEMRYDMGTDTTLTTVSSFASSKKLPGPNLKFDDGGAGLIQSLMKRIPNEKIKLNKGVQTIFWCEQNLDDEKLTVRCWDGTKFKARHVIVSVSLGALRCQNTLFCPQLPCDKIQAINSIPFGKVGKLFLRYKEPFWTEKNLKLRFGWTKEELMDRQDWVKGVGSIEQVPSDTDHILKVTVAGREAQMMEQNREQSAREFLEWMDTTIGFPLTTLDSVECVMTEWNNDIFIGGSNNYIAPVHQRILAKPLPDHDLPHIMFCGEGTLHNTIIDKLNTVISTIIHLIKWNVHLMI